MHMTFTLSKKNLKSWFNSTHKDFQCNMINNFSDSATSFMNKYMYIKC